MSNLQEFVDSLNLPFEGEMRDSDYVIRMNNSDDFSNLYNVISTNKDFNIHDDTVSTTEEARFNFTDGNYNLLFEADFDKDIYELIISRR